MSVRMDQAEREFLKERLRAEVDQVCSLAVRCRGTWRGADPDHLEFEAYLVHLYELLDRLRGAVGEVRDLVELCRKVWAEEPAESRQQLESYIQDLYRSLVNGLGLALEGDQAE